MTKSSSYKLAKQLSEEYNIPLTGSWVGTNALFWENEVLRINRTHRENERLRIKNVLNAFLTAHASRQIGVFNFEFDVWGIDYEGNTLRGVPYLQHILLPHMEVGVSYQITVAHTRLRSVSYFLTTTSKLRIWYAYWEVLASIQHNSDNWDYWGYHGGANLQCQLIRIPTVNPPIRRQRNNPIVNCAIKAVLTHLTKTTNKRNTFRIKSVNKLNDKYFKSGIGDEGLQELAKVSDCNIVVKDKIRKTWRKFESRKKAKTLLLVSHNNHLEVESDGDTSDGEDIEGITPEPRQMSSISVVGDELEKKEDKSIAQDFWCNTTDEVLSWAKFYENQNGNEGMPIISRNEMVAYITPDTIYKTKFPEWEIYGECFTSGGVGKAKFIEQHPEFKYGIDKSDPFYQLLMDSDQSGFYMRTEESKITNTKYDQNHAYKSFSKSGVFQGFPIIEAVFKVDKLYSEFRNPLKKPSLIDYSSDTDESCDCDGKCEFCLNDKLDPSNFSSIDNKFTSETILDDVHKAFMREIKSSNRSIKHGLLYVEAEKLTVSNLDKPIHYECSGWYPIEIVQAYYEQGINPVVKSYAYASKVFDIDFSTFTNDQFRTFLGKCISKSYDEVWRTKDFMELERARYILQNRIRRITQNGEYYQIEYVSEKIPWNFPVVSSYVKHHQKFNLFKQYNKLIANGIVPVAINVDGIEIKKPANRLFDIGKKEGCWKVEKVNVMKGSTAMVIERDIHPPPNTTVEFSQEHVLPRFLHFSGSGGNGKTEEIIKLNLIYSKLCYMAPTHEAVKNLLDRAETMNTKIVANTYHKIFATSSESRDSFDRSKYTHFILDECSMLSDGVLQMIISKLLPYQSLILAGDFWQLPCVEGKPIYDNWTNEASETYKKFEIRELTKNWRQQHDSEFFDLCQQLRNPLTEKQSSIIIEKLNKRVVPRNEELPDNSTLDDIHICGVNTQVDYENNKHKIELGSKVICNITCKDMEGKKVPNGSIGIISCLEENLVKIDWGTSASSFKGLGAVKGKAKFSLAYALTIHKAQGKTIKRNVIINPSRLFSKNHLYVALTRATKFDSVFLTQPMTMNIFTTTVRVNS